MSAGGRPGRRAVLAGAAALAWAGSAPARAEDGGAADGGAGPAYSVPGSWWADLPPADGGPPWRVFVLAPDGEPPAGGWPVLWLSDGNATFPLAAGSLRVQAAHPRGSNVAGGVVVAIGYPGDAPYDPLRRSWDLSPPPGRTYPPFTAGGPPVATGGADRFLAFIAGTAMPWVAAHLPVAAGRQTLFGHSFGGLFTLYALFTRPKLFRNWVAASPSIFWEDGAILAHEARRAPGPGGVLHLSAGEWEGERLAPFQADRPDAADLLARRRTVRTLENARAMAARLDGAPDGLRTRFEVFAGETHMSALPVAVNRAVRIAFAPPP